MQLLIKNVTVLQEGNKHHLKKRDILIKNGTIERIAASIKQKADKTVEGKKLFISVGWMDLFADFCDPGFEHKEDIESGLNSAKKGGFTDVCLIPNLNPVTDSKAQVEYIIAKSQSHICTAHPIAALSAGLGGEKLAEMYDMRSSGAIAFSDGLKSVESPTLMLKALEYLKAIDGTIIQLPDNKALTEGSQMNEGKMSTSLGLSGNPSIAEHIHIQRDIELCEYSNSRLHLSGISTAKSVQLVKQAKKKGVKVSCSVSPHHLLLDDTDLATYDSNLKLHAPLRTAQDKKALLKGLIDGSIDAVSSHHIPQDFDAKVKEFAYASKGMIGLGESFHLLLKAGLEPARIASVLGDGPRAVLNQNKSIKEGEEACLTVFTTEGLTELQGGNILSKSTNSYWLNKELPGKVVGIVNNKKNSL